MRALCMTLSKLMRLLTVPPEKIFIIVALGRLLRPHVVRGFRTSAHAFPSPISLGLAYKCSCSSLPHFARAATARGELHAQAHKHTRTHTHTRTRAPQLCMIIIVARFRRSLGLRRPVDSLADDFLERVLQAHSRREMDEAQVGRPSAI